LPRFEGLHSRPHCLQRLAAAVWERRQGGEFGVTRRSEGRLDVRHGRVEGSREGRRANGACDRSLRFELRVVDGPLGIQKSRTSGRVIKALVRPVAHSEDTMGRYRPIVKEEGHQSPANGPSGTKKSRPMSSVRSHDSAIQTTYQALQLGNSLADGLPDVRRTSHVVIFEFRTSSDSFNRTAVAAEYSPVILSLGPRAVIIGDTMCVTLVDGAGERFCVCFGRTGVENEDEILNAEQASSD